MRILMVIFFVTAVSAHPALGQVVNGIKALVSDEVITELEVKEATLPALEQLVRRYQNNPTELNDRYAAALGENLEELMIRQLLLHEYQVAGYSLPESLIDETIQSRVKERWGDRRTLTKSLQEQGRTYEGFRREMREQIIVDAMVSSFLGKDRFISPRQIEDYYNEHLEDYALEQQIHLSMIVLDKRGGTNDPVPALAAELLQKIEQGESFRDLAKTYSDGSHRRQGGDWGWVDRSVLREDLAEAAFSLEPGQVSQIIETPTACYILRVEAVQDAHYRPLREVQSEIERALQAEDRNERRAKWVERLKRKTFIRYF